MEVTVFLNKEETPDGRLAIFDRFPGAYHEGDALEAVYSYTVAAGGSVEAVLERAFSDFNRGSPTFVGSAHYRHRSVSVGDVIEVDGARYSVASEGFGMVGVGCSPEVLVRDNERGELVIEG